MIAVVNMQQVVGWVCGGILAAGVLTVAITFLWWVVRGVFGIGSMSPGEREEARFAGACALSGVLVMGAAWGLS